MRKTHDMENARIKKQGSVLAFFIVHHSLMFGFKICYITVKNCKIIESVKNNEKVYEINLNEWQD